MPYGLSWVPRVFKSLINDIFRDLLGKYIITYIDNILIYSLDSESPEIQVAEEPVMCQDRKV